MKSPTDPKLFFSFPKPPLLMTSRIVCLICLFPLSGALSPSAFGKKAAEPVTANTVAVVLDQKAEVTTEKPLSVIRVNVTNQPYDFFRPWTKRAPYQRRAVGPVLDGPGGKQVLVTGELVANATYVELEKPDSGEKTPAMVVALDYACNLALVKPVSERFLDSFKALALGESRIGDDLFVWQLEGNGTLLSTRALLTSAEVSRYPIDDTSLLLYRLTSALQPREGSFTTPVVRGDFLTGMVVRFDSRTQNADAIPAPVIRHFIKSAAEKSGGFPQAGFSFSALRDPQLRRYSGLTNGNDGVYITEVQRGSAAEKAGLQVGDVLQSIGDRPVDRDGNYLDPVYGKVSIVHLLSTLHFSGETVPFKIARQGDSVTLNVTLTHADPTKSVIEPYVIDRAPRYHIVGGLVFQELSRQYLKEWGLDWVKKAPDRFVYLDRYQSELFKDDPRERVVILSQVLPSPCTIGYEELSGLIVNEINGVKLKSIADIESALTNSIDGFHRIRFPDGPREIVLDAKEVAEIEPDLMKNYGLPALKSVEPEGAATATASAKTESGAAGK